MASVLLVATRYDTTTRRLYRWAKNLESTLSKSGHTVGALYGPGANSASLSGVSATAFVIFFGHGEPDRFIGQRGRFSLGSGPTLVDTTSVSLLQGSHVYAVCCQAGIQLGPAYARVYPSASFLAYQAPFGFSLPNAADFETIVNQSAIDFVAGRSTRAIHGDLQKAWRALADSFMNGGRQNKKGAFLAGYAASTNALFVSLNP
jgi:hypothetical protein